MAPLRISSNDFTENANYNFSTQSPPSHEARHHWRHHNHSHMREGHKHNVVDLLSNTIMEAMNSRLLPDNIVLSDLEPLSTHMEGSMDRHYPMKMNVTMNRSDLGVIRDEFMYRHGGVMTAVYCVAYLLVFIVGLVGNCFVIAVVYRSPRMRTVTNFFIVNLAVADILVIVFCLPATLMSNIFVREYLE